MKKEKYEFELYPALIDAITEMAHAQQKDVNRYVELILFKAVNAHHCDAITLHKENELAKCIALLSHLHK